MENLFTNVNLNDEQFRTHSNLDSEAVGLNLDLDSFDNVRSDTNYENSFSFDSLSNTQLQDISNENQCNYIQSQNQSYQPDLSLGEYSEDELDKEMRRYESYDFQEKLNKNPFKNNEPRNEKQSNQELKLVESKNDCETDESEFKRDNLPVDKVHDHNDKEQEDAISIQK